MLAKVHTQLCPHKKGNLRNDFWWWVLHHFSGWWRNSIQYSVTRDIPGSALCTSYRKKLPVLCYGRGNGYWSYEATFLEVKRFMNLTILSHCLILIFKGFFVHSRVQQSKVPQGRWEIGNYNISGHASCHEKLKWRSIKFCRHGRLEHFPRERGGIHGTKACVD